VSQRLRDFGMRRCQERGRISPIDVLEIHYGCPGCNIEVSLDELMEGKTEHTKPVQIVFKPKKKSA
jgi:hypothetical protein